MLKGKKILVGVCGSIAAYKTAILVRLLVKEGAEVKVIMTPSAKRCNPLGIIDLSFPDASRSRPEVMSLDKI